MTRKPLIAGNWKMNYNWKEAIAALQKFHAAFPGKYYADVDVAFMVPFTDLRSVQNIVEGDQLGFTYGAQDISKHDSGAYTGEISGEFIQALDADWVVVGHSERREYHHETDADVAVKSQQALKYELTPIVCVGEPVEVREAGEHLKYVLEQTKASLKGLSTADLEKIVIAYEPVWAIGTGKVASSADAQEVCRAIRGLIRELANESVAEGMRILYGGSVKTETVAELLTQPDVDGGLVGGASLDGEDFARLCAAAAQAV